MPHDGIKVIKTDAAADDADVGVKREYKMPSEIAARDTDVPHNADQSPARNEDAEYMAPDLLQLSEERLVILNVAELMRVFVVLFEVPIRRGCDNDMHRLCFQERQVPCIAVDESMKGGLHILIQRSLCTIPWDVRAERHLFVS